MSGSIATGDRVYQIRYYDEFTGKTVEIVHATLDEAVSAIKKARDELYFQGTSTLEPKPTIDYEKQPVKEQSDVDTSSNDSKVEEIKEIKSPWDEDDVYYHGLYFGSSD